MSLSSHELKYETDSTISQTLKDMIANKVQSFAGDVSIIGVR